MGAVKVAPAEARDVQDIAGLLGEMERYYGEAAEGELQEERVSRVAAVLFSERPSAFALLAWDGDVLAGIATYSFHWPAVNLSRSLFLKQLHVAEAHRGRSVGRILMEHVFEVARREGCSRVEWTTDDDNVAARDFYTELGFAPHRGKVLYRVEDARSSTGPP